MGGVSAGNGCQGATSRTAILIPRWNRMRGGSVPVKPGALHRGERHGVEGSGRVRQGRILRPRGGGGWGGGLTVEHGGGVPRLYQFRKGQTRLITGTSGGLFPFALSLPECLTEILYLGQFGVGGARQFSMLQPGLGFLQILAHILEACDGTILVFERLAVGLQGFFLLFFAYQPELRQAERRGPPVFSIHVHGTGD